MAKLFISFSLVFGLLAPYSSIASSCKALLQSYSWADAYKNFSDPYRAYGFKRLSNGNQRIYVFENTPRFQPDFNANFKRALRKLNNFNNRGMPNGLDEMDLILSPNKELKYDKLLIGEPKKYPSSLMDRYSQSLYRGEPLGNKLKKLKDSTVPNQNSVRFICLLKVSTPNGELELVYPANIRPETMVEDAFLNGLHQLFILRINHYTSLSVSFFGSENYILRH